MSICPKNKSSKACEVALLLSLCRHAEQDNTHCDE